MWLHLVLMVMGAPAGPVAPDWAALLPAVPGPSLLAGPQEALPSGDSQVPS
ncbi:MAG: hypothetical protein R3F33_11600 [Planctomycetota bacterium]